MRLRAYAEGDYPTLEKWWAVHDAEPMHESMIPSSSCIVEDDKGPLAFVSVFCCNDNHVAFVHGLVTRPGMKLEQTFEALSVLQDGIDIIMQTSNHTLLIGTVELGGMERGAQSMGFELLGNPIRMIGRVVQPQTN